MSSDECIVEGARIKAERKMWNELGKIEEQRLRAETKHSKGNAS
jgi:hypothetical protein|tara:strand:+ start:233 stop:364 length:132 start_codon:yes stop_codon:yes gene_type:complete